MASLWADGWFYISAGGFLVSCVLFVFLLGQYRGAVEAEDEELVADGPASVPAPSPQEKVYVPKPVMDAPAAAQIPLKSVAPAELPVSKPAAVPVPAVLPAAKPAAAAEPAKKTTESTGPLSPAVIYLQNLKGQMEHLDKDIMALKALASQHAAQNETILKRLSELTGKLESRAAAAAPEPRAPEPRALEIEPERAAAPAPAAPPSSEPIRTIELEITAAAAPEPEAKKPEAVPDSDKTMVIEPTVAPVKMSDNKTIPLPKPPGFEAQEPSKTEPAQPAQEQAQTPSEPAAEPSPKPARKGPVWPI